MKKNGKPLRLHTCPWCLTQTLYVDYKNGRVYKCLKCHKVLSTGTYAVWKASRQKLMEHLK